MKLDATGGVLATLACTATVFGLSMGPEKGWLSAITLGSGLVAMTAFVAFLVVERTAENPIVPFSLFSDRNRLATFATMFLVRGISFAITVVIACMCRTSWATVRCAQLSALFRSPSRCPSAGSCRHGW